MPDVIIGVVAVLVGGLLCFRGYAALRAIIAVWGAFAGFFLGAGLVSSFADERFLGSVLAWIVGGVVAIAFGLIAYAYYAVSVVIGMAAIGFTLGTTAMVAIGVSWSWVVVLVGIVAGILLAMLAIVGDLPMLILAILGALAGASTMIAGLLLVFGVLDAAVLASPETTEALELRWWWSAAYVVLVVAGLIAQFRSAETQRGTLREAWTPA